MNLFDKQPVLGTDVFVAPNAAVIGDVTLGNHASVFYGTVLRGAAGRRRRARLRRTAPAPTPLGTHTHRPCRFAPAADQGSITVGERTNIQDGTVVRTGVAALEDHAADTRIGARVTIGHQASLHGCVVEDEALIGMGATLLQGCKVRPAGGCWRRGGVQAAAAPAS
jgi:carbonic anhydrase/acetyltransferase-like protein (isoleucine patch superfamily)